MSSWSQSTLLLVAHGSSRYPESAGDLMRLAEQIRRENLFARVDVAFWRQEPVLSKDHLVGDKVYVLPFFAGIGKHSQELIPGRLGGDPRAVFCQPVGCHPSLPSLIAERSGLLCRRNGWRDSEVSLLLVAHGSRETGVSRTPQMIEARLREMARFAAVAAVYLEQAPFAKNWRDHVAPGKVIAQPLLLSAGMHLSEDVPPLFAGEERRVALQQGIGDDREIISMILDQVRAAS